MNPKIITFYLPQFHRVPENDKWWWEGFTDWDTAKKAGALFPGHDQPRIPLHENYYDLLDKSAMKWQAELAKKAGIYGFCMYHYWFGEKQLLEKPAENLLRWNDIDINYCFSWANVSWIRSWSKFTGNAWIASPKGGDSGDSGMLVEQKYGDKEEWKRHFLYLLPFFKDKRYIKRNNKPVFIIYHPSAVDCMRSMVDCWDQMAMEHGFSGIYFIGTNCEEWKKYRLNGALQYEPIYTRFQEKRFNSLIDLQIRKIREACASKNILFPELLSYRKTWKFITRRVWNSNVYPGGFVDFDTSPRKGKGSVIYYGVSPERFYKYLKKLYCRCQKNEVEYLFLTAWNEWREGAYLEPDSRYGTKYLNVIRKVTHQ